MDGFSDILQKMMQAITYVITSIIRFNYLIRNIDFMHSNLVRKMNKKILHEKLTMFTSAQHPPPRCTAYVHMMAKLIPYIPSMS